MQIDNLKKITVTNAQEICALATAGGFALNSPEGASPAKFLNGLVAAEDLNQAVQFLAFALPAREAVWWACLCAREGMREPVPTPLQAAIAAAEAWVRKPTEENRRAAGLSAQATDLKSPAAWAAMAAFWSGGSLAPENLPEVAAPPQLLGSAVASAVMLAAVKPEPKFAGQKRARYVQAAVDIANGGNGRISAAGA